MLIIRFQRVGKRNQSLFRIVLTEKTAPPKGKYIEKLGFHNPIEKETILDKERILYWLGKGAKPSDTVWNLLIKKGIIKDKKIKIKIKKTGNKKQGIENEEHKIPTESLRPPTGQADKKEKKTENK